MTGEIEYADRYGGQENWPDPETVCKGQCEGTGVIPVYMSKGDTRASDPMSVRVEDETDKALIAAWEVIDAETPANDGWHFVKCPTCGGGGKR